MGDGSILILTGNEVLSLLSGRTDEVMTAVKSAYECHRLGSSALPHSTFLRFPNDDRNRIIALPAYLGGDHQGAGVKWVASFPGNLEKGMDRASAVVILNSTTTGRPEAIMEGSVINAKRTAASAALAAQHLHGDKNIDRLGILGCGIIGFEIQRFLLSVFSGIKTTYVYDLDRSRAARFKAKSEDAFEGLSVEVTSGISALMRCSSLIVLATTAGRPHIFDLDGIAQGATILNISLRDLSPELILSCDNIVDDADHVCREGTSLHMAEGITGNRDFIRGTLADVTLGRLPARREEHGLTVFSPFGLGVLDIALARLLLKLAVDQSRGLVLDSFLPKEPS
ncbi:MAG: 2,3-diaminopropionate biosynthesis protein SbnB [Blastocatellia bacterium]